MGARPVGKKNGKKKTIQATIVKKSNTFIKNEIKKDSGQKGPEGHYHEVEMTGTGIADTGGMECLSMIATGNTISTRIGNEIEAQSVRITGNFAGSNSAPDVLARIILFYDKENNGELPTLEALLEDREDATPNSMDVYRQTDITNKRRFVILKDKTFALNANGNVHHYIDWFIKLHGLKMYYGGTDATIGHVVNNGLFIAWIGNKETSETVPTFRFISRLKYNDL